VLISTQYTLYFVPQVLFALFKAVILQMIFLQRSYFIAGIRNL